MRCSRLPSHIGKTGMAPLGNVASFSKGLEKMKLLSRFGTLRN